jgi:hypothetical protein
VDQKVAHKQLIRHVIQLPRHAAARVVHRRKPKQLAMEHRNDEAMYVDRFARCY